MCGEAACAFKWSRLSHFSTTTKLSGTEFRARAALGVDHRTVFDAAGLGMHRRHVGTEVPQHLVALAWLGW